MAGPRDRLGVGGGGEPVQETIGKFEYGLVLGDSKELLLITILGGLVTVLC